MCDVILVAQCEKTDWEQPRSSPRSVFERQTGNEARLGAAVARGGQIFEAGGARACIFIRTLNRLIRTTPQLCRLWQKYCASLSAVCCPFRRPNFKVFSSCFLNCKSYSQVAAVRQLQIVSSRLHAGSNCTQHCSVNVPSQLLVNRSILNQQQCRSNVAFF